MKIISDSKEAENLPSGTISLYKDKNENLNIILKDDDIDKLLSIELVHFSKKDNEFIVLILNNQKVYKDSIGNSKEEIEILKKLKKRKNINIIVWTREKNIYPIILAKYKKIKERDFEMIMDTKKC